MMIRVNIGCGKTPIEGWHNYDNSLSVLLSKIPLALPILETLRLLKKEQKEFIIFCKNSHIKWADATRKIPERSRSVDVLYSSHMLEHLDSKETSLFLKEVLRVLKSKGIVRLAVPDLHVHVQTYLKTEDADEFIKKLNFHLIKQDILRRIIYLVIGNRYHKWMYDGSSLCKLLDNFGFVNCRIMKAGSTMIPEPGALNLREREAESVFVEALRP